MSDPDRPTTVKTRIIADQRQQVVRYDQEVKREAINASRTKLLSYLKKKCASVQALIISDYAKGVISPSLLKELLSLAQRTETIICADHPKATNHTLYENHATIITPNKKEASRVSGIEIETEENYISV